MEDILLEINRYGFVEETHFTIAYSPVPDETAPRGIGGVLATVHEITEKVIAERRVVALRDLGARTLEAKSAEEACRIAAAALASHARDVPFALLYLMEEDGQRARLAGAFGVNPGDAVSPAEIEIAAADAGWPLGKALRADALVVVDDLAARFANLPVGPWASPPRAAAVLPVRANTGREVAGFLVAAASPRLRLDELYLGFFELVATQIATTIANARAYEEERKRAEALAEIDRAKTAFFSNVSHEFRTPLTLILGSLDDLLQKSSDEVAREGHALGTIAHRNGLRLLKLVNTLLDFSRIEAGRVQASYEPTDLSTFTLELVSNFRSACEKAGLTLAVDCPPLDEPVYVDRDMWEKIVLNLVSNAFKYTRDGGIAVTLRRSGAEAQLAVADTGIGIAEHEMPRLFERFHRVEGAHGRTHEGTGIGLALVQELVRLHGGSVRVRSELGKGSTFTVAVPLGTARLAKDRIKAARTAASTAISAQSFVEEAQRWLQPENEDTAAELASDALLREDAILATGPEDGTGRPSILLADDNSDMRDYVRRLLSGRYEVHAVSDGEAALAALRERPFDLLLSDIMMPRLDGFGLLRAVRADPLRADLPVILLSARAGEEASVEGLEAGADDYLIKPFSARELLARIASNLELARLRRMRRQAEQELRAQDAFTRSIFESSPDCIELLDRDGRLTFINRSGLSLREIDESEPVVGRPWAEPWPEEQRATALTALAEALAGKISRFQGLSRTAKGRPRWWDVVLGPVRSADGTPDRIVAISRDITELKASEQALRALSAELQQRVTERSQELETEVSERRKVEEALLQVQRLEAVGQLTGGIAHDFNNLLTVVMAQAENIIRAAKDDEQIVRMAAAVQRVAERGARMTNQLLSFSRRQQLQPEPILANRLLTAHGDFFRRAIGEAVAVEFDAAPELWPCLVDSAQLEAAILNLVVNAGAAMPDGGRLTIKLRNATLTDTSASQLDVKPGDYVLVTVSDTGCGMSPDVKSRCFEPFYTTKDVGKGTGLGLSQVYGFARQSGGTATVESAIGSGTTIALYLRRATRDPAAEPRITLEPQARRGRGRTVLVVEDQPDVRNVIERALKEAGYRVLTARDGVEAMAALATGRKVDLLLTDIVMPNGLSGVALARAVEQKRHGMKIVLMTGYAEPAQFDRADAKYTVLRKPFRHADLIRVIEASLETAVDGATAGSMACRRGESEASTIAP